MDSEEVTEVLPNDRYEAETDADWEVQESPIEGSLGLLYPGLQKGLKIRGGTQWRPAPGSIEQL